MGWLTGKDGRFWPGVIDDAGHFIKGPEAVIAAGVGWGNRDESFRTRVDGRVSWVQAEVNGSVIRLFRFDGAPFLPQGAGGGRANQTDMLYKGCRAGGVLTCRVISAAGSSLAGQPGDPTAGG